ncbi:dephospho-CoA kinase [Marinobacterium zhoushanense]|uniref:Dephospho-CoA kinase n=1 Tax=Marinobacterium zhoushanense TaxID=1679163 RepID=A0ABQ1KA05_9GAMM|nr:dephospho-CoA kinase [Marinobacterium zhoushanense]GGB87584.1 dephospho-CoA kinase [Marinobacterium zhoushanense]
MSAPLKVGLTGGIGSGKSAATALFAELGVPIIDADLIAREVVQPGEPALNCIAEHFGTDILMSDGGLNRACLREIIFNDSSEKAWLEGLLHPLIRDRIIERMSQSGAVYLILVSPLLIESGQAQLVEQVIVVDVDEQTQVERTLARDAVDREQVERILAAQMSRQARCARADYLIDNSGDLAALRAQVERVHHALLKQAG